MPLDDALIARLLANKNNPVKKRAPASSKASTGVRAKRHIRHKTQYPDLVPNKYVKRYVGKGIKVSTPCTSTGCRAPSYYLFDGSPLCSVHLIYALVYELDRITSLSNLNSVNKISPLPGTQAGGGKLAAGPHPASISLPVTTNGSEDDDDSYL
jgi:hypothetical protein